MMQVKRIKAKNRWLVFSAFLLFVAAAFSPVAAQNDEAENNYRQFLQIYRAEEPTHSELEAALGYVETANRLQPNTYKYVFSIGALNSTLKRWEPAIEWLEQAKTLASTPRARENVEIELNYNKVQLARVKVEDWGDEPVKISFVMKQGTVEMSADMVAKLPQALPRVPVNESPEPIVQLLSDRLRVSKSRIGLFDGFVVVAMSEDYSARRHFERGISSFHRFFRDRYFTDGHRDWITVLIAERPLPLVHATKDLYPSVDLPEYAPFLGYFNPSDNLIMATGGRSGYGTLLHELIHALIHDDFKNAPVWFDEALSSLYERTQWRDGELRGLPNWRMDHMREASVDSLAELAARAAEIGLHSREISEFRLLLLFVEQRDQLGDLYRMARQDGAAFSLASAIDRFELTEADWREFLNDTFSAYQAELAKNRGALSHPDEVRFVQQALKQTVDPAMAVDGHWGEKTIAALEEFQRRYGLAVDGIIGPKTAAELKRQYERTLQFSAADQ